MIDIKQIFENVIFDIISEAQQSQDKLAEIKTERNNGLKVSYSYDSPSNEKLLEYLNQKIDLSNQLRWVTNNVTPSHDQNFITLDIQNPESIFNGIKFGNNTIHVRPCKMKLFNNGLACIELDTEKFYDVFSKYDKAKEDANSINEANDKIRSRNLKQKQNKEQARDLQIAAKKNKQQKQNDELEKLQKKNNIMLQTGIPEDIIKILNNGSFSYYEESENDGEICGLLYWRPTLMDICRIFTKQEQSIKEIPLAILVHINNNDNFIANSRYMDDGILFESEDDSTQSSRISIFKDKNGEDIFNDIRDSQHAKENSKYVTFLPIANPFRWRSICASVVENSFKKVHIYDYIKNYMSERYPVLKDFIPEFQKYYIKETIIKPKKLNVRREDFDTFVDDYMRLIDEKDSDYRKKFVDFYNLEIKYTNRFDMKLHKVCIDKNGFVECGNLGNIMYSFNSGKASCVLIDSGLFVVYDKNDNIDSNKKVISAHYILPEPLLNNIAKAGHKYIDNNSMSIDFIIKLFSNTEMLNRTSSYEQSEGNNLFIKATNTRRYI